MPPETLDAFLTYLHQWGGTYAQTWLPDYAAYLQTGRIRVEVTSRVAPARKKVRISLDLEGDQPFPGADYYVTADLP